MHGLLMVAALPAMLLGGLLLDAFSHHDDHHKDETDDHDPVVGDMPDSGHPPLI